MQKTIIVSLFLALLSSYSCNTFEWNLDKKPNIALFEIESIQDTSLVIDYEIESPDSPVSEIKCLVFTDTLYSPFLTYTIASLSGTQVISPINSSTNYFIQLACENEVGLQVSKFKIITTKGPPGSPEVETTGFNEVSPTSIQLSGYISSIGASNVSSRGFYYSNSANISNPNVVYCGSGQGSFSYNLNDLNTSTRYYFQAFAINSSGTSLGQIMMFQTSSYYHFSIGEGTGPPPTAGGGSYTQVIGGIQVVPGIQDNYVGDFSMPFPFYFGTDKVNDVYVSSNGFISFNNFPSSTFSPFEFNNLANSVAFFAREDGKTDNEGVNYIVQGSAPNRVCIVDFHEWHWNGGITDEMSAQIKLFESSNAIEIVYGLCTAYNIIPGNSYSGSVGIGNSNFAMVTYNDSPNGGCWNLSTTMSEPSQYTYLGYGNSPCGQTLRWEPGL